MYYWNDQIRRAEHVARTGELTNECNILIGDHSQDLVVNGRIILKWI